MKKAYLKPNVELAIIHLQSVICESMPEENGEGTGNHNLNNGAPARLYM